MAALRQFWQQVFPRARQPMTWKSALPLILFLLIFGGLCLWLELSNRLMFVRPWAFALLLVTPWVWWMSAAGFSGLSRGRNLIALLVRLALVGLFVMLIAEPRAVRTRDVLSVVYVVDVSDSVDKSTDQALEYVTRTVGEKPEDDEAGLVVFGRNSAVELPPRMSFPFENIINSRIDRDATNIEQALSLGAAMLPEENRGRIVLISDGTETNGNLKDVLDDLKSRGIAVDVLPIKYQYDEEVLLERLELPRFVKIGENYEASILLQSLTDGKGTLVMEENGTTVYSEEVEYKAGKNRYTLPIKLREPGYYEYRAVINTGPDEDHLKKNNEVINYIFVEGEGKVLVVTDPEGLEDDWQQLAATIRDGERVVDVKTAYDLPRDAMSLMPYDAVVFVNVAIDEFDSVQLNALHDAVKNLGVGFMMVGGPNSFGPGGYHRSVVEDTLPVTMDITKKKILPKGALVVILHTCEFPQGNDWAKKITKQAIKVLGAQDEVGAIGYGFGGTTSGEHWIFELTEARHYDKLVPKINAAEIGDMPSFDTTMIMGLNGLKKSDAASRHMIIISDGDPPMPPPAVMKDFQDSQVSVSTVAVFPHGGRDVNTLRSIAQVTKGRFYYPDDPNQLPSIFIKEAKTLRRNMIQTRTFSPEFEFTDSIVKGIDGLPDLHGYVLTTAKERSKVVIKAPPASEDDDEVDPILAVWRYGLGTTAAFTSDFSPNWGKDWMGWEQFRPLIKQTMTRILRERTDGHLRMSTYTKGNEGIIVIEDYHPDSMFLDLTAQVSGPRDQSRSIPIRQIAPRRYQATVPLWGKGRYQVIGVGKAGDRSETVMGGFIVPYSPEYVRFRSDPVALNEIAEKTEGEPLAGETSEENSDAKTIYGRRQPKRSSWPIFDWFLCSLAILVPLDVGIRRVQIDPYVIKSFFGFGKKKESTKTMGQLLDRKKSVDATFESRRKETPLPTTLQKPISGQAIPRKAEAAKPKPQPSTPEPTQEESSSTTSRLLDLKRKRDAENPE